MIVVCYVVQVSQRFPWGRPVIARDATARRPLPRPSDAQKRTHTVRSYFRKARATTSSGCCGWPESIVAYVAILTGDDDDDDDDDGDGADDGGDADDDGDDDMAAAPAT